MRNSLWGWAVCLLVTVKSALSVAEPAAPTEHEFWQKNFQGWRAIQFQCYRTPRSKWSEKVCDGAIRDAQALATAASVKFLSCIDCNLYQSSFEAAVEHALIVEVNITSASFRTGITGGTVDIRAEGLYSNAVESNAPPDSPESRPKSGTLVIWEKTISFLGEERDLPFSVSSRIKQVLEEFSAIFIEAQH